MSGVRRWSDYSTDEIGAEIAALPVAILPLGAVEEHGPHLPIGTDNIAAAALAERLAARTGCLLLPTLNYGQVWSLARFPGSLTLREETLRNVLTDLAEALFAQGVRGLMLLSGHLGNLSAMRASARVLHDRLPALAVQAVAYPGLAEVAAGIAESPQWHPGYIHAEEIETSLVLALAPGRVRMERARREYPPLPPDFSVSAVQWDELGEGLSGVFGDATAASQAKGKAILARYEERLVGLAEALKARVRSGR